MSYSLFYNRKAIGDVLIVVINPFLDATNYKKEEQLIILYHEDEIIGYNIFDISKVIKIHYEGLIVNPIQPLIDVINSILKNHNYPTLVEDKIPNFIVGEVCKVENDIYYVDIGEKIIDVCLKSSSLEVSNKVVVIRPNTMLPNAKISKNYVLANKAMLMLDDSDEILKLDEGIIGNDFYKGDIKWNN